MNVVDMNLCGIIKIIPQIIIKICVNLTDIIQIKLILLLDMVKNLKTTILIKSTEMEFFSVRNLFIIFYFFRSPKWLI